MILMMIIMMMMTVTISEDALFNGVLFDIATF